MSAIKAFLGWFIIPPVIAYCSLRFAWGMECKRVWLFIGLHLAYSLALLVCRNKKEQAK